MISLMNDKQTPVTKMMLLKCVSTKYAANCIKIATFSNVFSWIQMMEFRSNFTEIQSSYKPALVRVTAWRRTVDKLSSEPTMTSSVTHICGTRGRWVNDPVQEFLSRDYLMNDYIFFNKRGRIWSWNWKYTRGTRKLSPLRQPYSPLTSLTRSAKCVPMMTSSNGSIFRVTGPLWGASTGHRWIPFTKANDSELGYFFDLCLNKRLNKQSRKLWFETPSRSSWRHWNAPFSFHIRI